MPDCLWRRMHALLWSWFKLIFACFLPFLQFLLKRINHDLLRAISRVFGQISSKIVAFSIAGWHACATFCYCLYLLCPAFKIAIICDSATCKRALYSIDLQLQRRVHFLALKFYPRHFRFALRHNVLFFVRNVRRVRMCSVKFISGWVPLCLVGKITRTDGLMGFRGWRLPVDLVIIIVIALCCNIFQCPQRTSKDCSALFPSWPTETLVLYCYTNMLQTVFCVQKFPLIVF